jgi:hypothetical protein
MMGCRRPFILISVVAVGASALLAAGCGSKSSPGVARVASSTTAATTTTRQDGLVAFSHCMRSHGLQNFPDPQSVRGRTLKLTVQRIATSNPRFPAAQRACSHLLPNGGVSESRETARQAQARRAAALSFAGCMRRHGLSRFPDPTGQGELTVEMVQAQGIDVHSPAVLHVVQACLPASHGWLTPAKVRAALNETGR